MESQNQQSANPLRQPIELQKNADTRMIAEQSPSKDRESDEQNNEDYCFKCKRRGDIYCCDNCPRSFHAEGGCLPRRPTEAVWRCPCCRLRDQCPVCEVAVQPVDRHFVCNICYRRTHNMCTGLPKDLLTNKIDDDIFYMQECLFICYVCLYNSQIKMVVKTIKYAISGDYKLVCPYFSSGIHLGWLTESNFNKISEKPRKLKHAAQQQTVYKRPSIDRLLSIQCPLVHRGKSVYEVIELIRDTKRRIQFGDPNNFKFLVKWKGEDYLNSTWEDEMVVKASKCHALQQFLLRKEYEMHCLIQKTATIKDFRVPPPRPTFNQKQEALIKQLINMYLSSKNIFLMKFNGQKNYQIIIAAVMCQLFYYELLTQPFLILTRYRDLTNWANVINEYCPGMYLVIMTGLLENRNIIKARELFYEEASTPKFDILLTTYDCLSKDVGMFYNNQINVSWAGIIYDEELKSHGLIDKKPKVKVTHKIILSKQIAHQDVKAICKILHPLKKISPASSVQADRETLLECVPRNMAQFIEIPLQFSQKKYTPIKITIKPANLVNPVNIRKSEPDISDDISEYRPNPQIQRQSERQSQRQDWQSQKQQEKPSERQDDNIMKPQEEQRSSDQNSAGKPKTISINDNPSIMSLNYKQTIKFLHNVQQDIITKELPLEKFKRIAFLRFVVTFGIDFPDSQSMLNKLIEFQRGVFQNSDQQKKKLEEYIMIFLALLNSRNPELYSRVLFGLQPNAVLRRLTDLHNIHMVCQKYGDNPKTFPIKKSFDLIIDFPFQSIKEGAWDESDDLLLFQLIIELGYDNWQQICESRKWIPETYLQSDRDAPDFFLKKIADLPTAGPIDKLKSCCRLANNRAKFMIQLVRKQVENNTL